MEVSEHLDGVKEESGSIGPVAKEDLTVTAHSWQFQEPIWQVSRQLQGPGLEISERFGGFEGNIRQFRTGRKERLDLPQLIVWQFQEPVWQVSRQLQGPDLEVSERLEGLKEESGSIGPVAKERLDLSQLIVWQFQEPVWQVSQQLQGPGLEVSERLQELKKYPVLLGVPQPTARQLQEPVWQVSWQLQELGLEVSEHLEGLKEESGSIGPVAKERLDLSQLIVWQFQEPIWQVSRGPVWKLRSVWRVRREYPAVSHR